MTATDYVTKAELREELVALEERLDSRISFVVSGAVKEVSDIFANGLQMISDRFDLVEERLDRIEDKLDRTIARDDLHDVDIRQIKRGLGLT